MRRAPERRDAALRYAVLTLSHALGRPTRRTGYWLVAFISRAAATRSLRAEPRGGPFFDRESPSSARRGNEERVYVQQG